MTDSLALIYAAVDEVNAQILGDPKIVKDPNTSLLDVDGGVDSLTLVNLLAALEQLVFDKTGKTIIIADESVFASPNNPFRNIGSLAAHIDTLLG